MIHKAKSVGNIQGVATVRGGTRLSHLFFTDDSILFCRTTAEKWDRVKTILGKYERGGQVVNNSKSAALDRQAVLQASGNTTCGNYNKYLGLPTFVGRSKYNSFRWIKEKVCKEIIHGKTKC